MCMLIQVAIGCRDPRNWVTVRAELAYSTPESLHAWHRVISVIDICPEWRNHVTRFGLNCNADLAVQPIELCQAKSRCLSCWQLAAQWQGSEWPLVYCANLSGRGLQRHKVLSYRRPDFGVKKLLQVSMQDLAAGRVLTFNTAWHI